MEGGAPGGRMYNTHLLVDPDGGYEGGDQVYRKLHLFDADVDGGYGGKQ